MVLPLPERLASEATSNLKGPCHSVNRLTPGRCKVEDPLMILTGSYFPSAPAIVPNMSSSGPCLLPVKTLVYTKPSPKAYEAEPQLKQPQEEARTRSSC